VSKTIGKAFTPANCLKRAHFPSITGSAASGPIFPSPRTADPSDITATVFPLRVYFFASSLSCAIARHGSATPGEYTVERSSLFSIGVLRRVSIFH